MTIVSHDAGGAEVLSSYVKRKNLNCFYVLGGPAISIFERKLGAIRNDSLQKAIEKSDEILCGTSWQSELEWEAIRLARSYDKHSIAFLDHWVNFKERFLRHGQLNLPDEIWVGDEVAEDIARNIFTSVPIKVVANPYFEDIRQELKTMANEKKIASESLSILYVCEPIREHALKQYGREDYWGYTEEDALRFFLSNVNSFGTIDQIVIRPHPSESKDKYNWVHNEFDLPLVIGERTLVEEIMDCRVVVGCQSMAMVIGLLAGKKVISAIPPGGAACNLPHAEIISLQTLGALSN